MVVLQEDGALLTALDIAFKVRSVNACHELVCWWVSHWDECAGCCHAVHVQISDRGVESAALLRAAGALTASELLQPGRFSDPAALLRLLPPSSAETVVPAAVAEAERGGAEEL